MKQWWFGVVYIALIVFLMPHSLTWNYKIIYILYALIVFCAVFYLKKRNENSKPDATTDKKRQNIIFAYVLIFSIALIVISRLLPFIRFGETPLGYDTGFYLSYFNYSNALFNAFTPFYLNVFSSYALGLPALESIYFIYILSQLLIAGGIYALLRSLKIKNGFAIATIAVFLFAVSMTQFQAYWWMFGQQLLSLAFLIFTLALIFKGSFLSIFTGVVGLLIHPPTFIILAFALSIFFAIYVLQILFKKRNIRKNVIFIALLLLGAAIFIAILKLQYFIDIFNFYILEHKGLASSFVFYEIPKMKGTFISPETFYQNIYILLPYALIGIIYAKIWGKKNSSTNDHLTILYCIIVGLFILTSFAFIYQHRFLILFDVFLIVFSAPVLFTLIKNFLSDRVYIICALMLLFAFTAKLGITVYLQKPQVSASELSEIKSSNDKLKKNSVILVTNSLYSPWLVGFSDKTIICPGFYHDNWNFNDWMKFWSSNDNKVRINLLNGIFLYYPYPLYIYIGEKQDKNLPYQAFIRTDSRFQNISPHFWKYTAGSENE
ncbi:MAG: hypothetical protein V1928_04185 [Parcubacteria group bacterium]